MNRLLRLVLFWGVFVVLTLLWACSLAPVGCGNSVLNIIFHVVLALSPTIIALATFSLRLGQRFAEIRVIAMILGPLLSGGALLSLLLLGSLDTSGAHEGTRLIKELPITDGSRLRAYRLNGGATMAYDVMVQHETPLIGPIFRYDRIYEAYRQMDVDISLSDDQRTLVIRGSVDGRDSVAVVPL